MLPHVKIDEQYKVVKFPVGTPDGGVQFCRIVVDQGSGNGDNIACWNTEEAKPIVKKKFRDIGYYDYQEAHKNPAAFNFPDEPCLYLYDAFMAAHESQITRQENGQSKWMPDDVAEHKILHPECYRRQAKFQSGKVKRSQADFINAAKAKHGIAEVADVATLDAAPLKKRKDVATIGQV